MRRFLITAGTVAAATVGVLVAIPVLALRRYRERNRVTVVHVKPAPVLRVHRGGKA